MAGDERKDYIGQIILQTFKKGNKADIIKNAQLDNFLDDGNILTLAAFLNSSKQLHIDTSVSKEFPVKKTLTKQSAV